MRTKKAVGLGWRAEEVIGKTKRNETWMGGGGNEKAKENVPENSNNRIFIMQVRRIGPFVYARRVTLHT